MVRGPSFVYPKQGCKKYNARGSKYSEIKWLLYENLNQAGEFAGNLLQGW